MQSNDKLCIALPMISFSNAEMMCCFIGWKHRKVLHEVYDAAAVIIAILA
jgi:hypothetical protein